MRSDPTWIGPVITRDPASAALSGALAWLHTCAISRADGDTLLVATRHARACGATPRQLQSLGA